MPAITYYLSPPRDIGFSSAQFPTRYHRALSRLSRRLSSLFSLPSPVANRRVRTSTRDFYEWTFAPTVLVPRSNRLPPHSPLPPPRKIVKLIKTQWQTRLRQFSDLRSDRTFHLVRNIREQITNEFPMKRLAVRRHARRIWANNERNDSKDALPTGFEGNSSIQASLRFFLSFSFSSASNSRGRRGKAVVLTNETGNVKSVIISSNWELSSFLQFLTNYRTRKRQRRNEAKRSKKKEENATRKR